MTSQIQLVRLNARIHNQREQIKHGQFVLEAVSSRANHLLDLLGIDRSQPLAARLDEAIAAIAIPSREGQDRGTGLGAAQG